jgi:predicted CoA-substrate-specific enzyme activase
VVSAGIDIGHQTVQALILEEGQVAAQVGFQLSGGVEATARFALGQVLARRNSADRPVRSVFVTGVGRENAGIARGRPTEMASHARGAQSLIPGARTAIDMGAEGARVLRCDGEGKLSHFILNDKCASGTGVFLETVASMMRVPLGEMGPLSLRASGTLTLTTTCAVFAESEIVAEVHRGTPREEILWAVHDSIAARIAAIARRVGVEAEVVATGGVARNVGIVEALSRHLGLPVRVPRDPEMTGALGAAILAAESFRRGVSRTEGGDGTGEGKAFG